MADDPVAAALAEAGEAVGALPEAPATSAVGRLVLTTLKLAEAVTAAQGFHKPDNLYGNAATLEEPGNCPHGPDAACHFEAGDGSGEWLCEGRPEGIVCETCVDGEGGGRVDWPCPEYQAIIAALSGNAAPDAQIQEVPRG
jgi:hypothetical protein